jgi:hypothetical protein
VNVLCTLSPDPAQPCFIYRARGPRLGPLSSAAWTALRSAGAWRRPKGRRASATRSIERPTGRSTR